MRGRPGSSASTGRDGLAASQPLTRPSPGGDPQPIGAEDDGSTVGALNESRESATRLAVFVDLLGEHRKTNGGGFHSFQGPFEAWVEGRRLGGLGQCGEVFAGARVHGQAKLEASGPLRSVEESTQFWAEAQSVQSTSLSRSCKHAHRRSPRLLPRSRFSHSCSCGNNE